jgi:hypothetical protein
VGAAHPRPRGAGTHPRRSDVGPGPARTVSARPALLTRRGAGLDCGQEDS